MSQFSNFRWVFCLESSCQHHYHLVVDCSILLLEIFSIIQMHKLTVWTWPFDFYVWWSLYENLYSLKYLYLVIISSWKKKKGLIVFSYPFTCKCFSRSCLVLYSCSSIPSIQILFALICLLTWLIYHRHNSYHLEMICFLTWLIYHRHNSYHL